MFANDRNKQERFQNENFNLKSSSHFSCLIIIQKWLFEKKFIKIIGLFVWFHLRLVWLLMDITKIRWYKWALVLRFFVLLQPFQLLNTVLDIRFNQVTSTFCNDMILEKFSHEKRRIEMCPWFLFGFNYLNWILILDI